MSSLMIVMVNVELGLATWGPEIESDAIGERRGGLLRCNVKQLRSHLVKEGASHRLATSKVL